MIPSQASSRLFKQINPEIFKKLRKDTKAVVFTPGERACTNAVINKDGDLLFVTSGDKIYGYNLFTESCFRVYSHDESGVFEGVDINFDSTFLVAIADKSIFIYDVATGKLCTEQNKAMMACCCFADGLNRVAVVSSSRLNQKIILTLYSIVQTKDSLYLQEKGELPFEFPISCIIWPNEKTIIVGDNQGNLYLLKLAFQNKNEPIQITVEKKIQPHRGEICHLTLSPDKLYFATASKDNTAKLFHLTLDEFASFAHSTMVSCAAISPITHHIVLASSADQVLVANTAGAVDFTINFFHTIFNEEFASMKVHKSTVNWVGFTPDGFTLVTISHEGTMQIIRLGEDYRQIILEQEEELNSIEESLKTK